MTAAAAAAVAIAPATPADLDAILEIERHSFPAPWTRDAFAAELARPHARLVVARLARPPRPPIVAGFCSYWLAAGELEIHSIATHPDLRRATLEVRRGNAPAIALYERAGFRCVHVRARYYRDNDEDALVMLRELVGPALTAPTP